MNLFIVGLCVQGTIARKREVEEKVANSSWVLKISYLSPGLLLCSDGQMGSQYIRQSKHFEFVYEK